LQVFIKTSTHAKKDFSSPPFCLFKMWSTFRSVFTTNAAPALSSMDPREPDVPRTPPSQWKRVAEPLDPRSPSMGIARTPIPVRMPYERVSQRVVSLESVPSLNWDTKKSVEEPLVAANAGSPVRDTVPPVQLEAVSVDTESKLAQLRGEFSSKKQRHQQQPRALFDDAGDAMLNSPKAFLSSPALWRTMAMSSPAFTKTPDSTARDQQQQQQPWESPSFRRALFRHDSASAA
jgi:hypothetical protein